MDTRATDRVCYGSWALVTGASSGIGRAFAFSLAARGFNVVLAARRQRLLESLAEELREAAGIEVLVVPADFSDPRACESLDVSTATLDVGLVVLAAGFGTSGPFAERGRVAELEMIDVNCRAVAHLCALFEPRLRRRGGGALVLMSSIVAFQGVPRAANYAASKAYVQSLAEGLAREGATHGVEVLACAPGPVASGFGDRAGMYMPRATAAAVIADRTLRALGRSGTVRPGFRAKLLGWSLATAPRPLRVRIMAAIMGGMTRRQGAP